MGELVPVVSLHKLAGTCARPLSATRSMKSTADRGGEDCECDCIAKSKGYWISGSVAK